MEFTRPVTIGLFVAIIAVGTLGVMPMMTTSTVLMMVLSSMAIFGLITLLLGVKHGQYQATH